MGALKGMHGWFRQRIFWFWSAQPRDDNNVIIVLGSSNEFAPWYVRCKNTAVLNSTTPAFMAAITMQLNSASGGVVIERRRNEGLNV